ncbi:MAG: hypothetical protein GX950_01580 [Candidatus Diapherotrites archaeon]|uniref:Histidine kinase N-terminal 7TM region domain-containing protein n=1 Tax=Candidatus Iainarchaeum sp. TaxID=3101447 RepID=A0A7K4BYZ9_9ARCH|nr:hypothetical protein [Candidatus Diapherotrites archaeon]
MGVPWEFLKEPIYALNEFQMYFAILFLIVAFVLFVISILALRKKTSKRLMVVSATFGLFFTKSILVTLDYFFSPGYFMNYTVQVFFDLTILTTLFIALLKK